MHCFHRETPADRFYRSLSFLLPASSFCPQFSVETPLPGPRDLAPWGRAVARPGEGGGRGRPPLKTDSPPLEDPGKSRTRHSCLGGRKERELSFKPCLLHKIPKQTRIKCKAIFPLLLNHRLYYLATRQVTRAFFFFSLSEKTAASTPHPSTAHVFKKADSSSRGPEDGSVASARPRTGDQSFAM